MRLQLFVCPMCGDATLHNPSVLRSTTAAIDLKCVRDWSPMSFVHDVDLRPTPERGQKEVSDFTITYRPSGPTELRYKDEVIAIGGSAERHELLVRIAQTMNAAAEQPHAGEPTS